MNPDFDIVFDDDPSKLRYFAVAGPVPTKPETLAADTHARVQDAAVPQRRVAQDADVVPDHTVRADSHPCADIGPGSDPGARADLNIRIDHGTGADLDVGAELRLRMNRRAGMDAPARHRRDEPARDLEEELARLGHSQQPLTGYLGEGKTNQDQCSRALRHGVGLVCRLGKTEIPWPGLIEGIDAVDLGIAGVRERELQPIIETLERERH